MGSRHSNWCALARICWIWWSRDLIMPRLNGVQLVQILSVETPELPFVLISGYAPPELAAFGVVAPCGVLAKPLVEEVFLAQVKRCLRQRN